MNTTTKAQRTNKRQDAIWEKAKRASEMTDEEHEQLQARKTAGAQGCAYVPPADKSAHTPKTSVKWAQRCGELQNAIESLQGQLDNLQNNHDALVTEYNALVERTEANARLIAAAPDLLQACKDALRALTPTVGARNPTSYLILQDAIAKAEGQ